MTNAELAILSLVAEQPRHGYQIEQVIEERFMRLWTEIGHSSIYFLLKKLEQVGLIKGQLEETEHGPARKVYRPTPEGWKALRAGLIEVLSVPHPYYQPLHLGLRNLALLPPTETLAALRQYHQSLTAQQEHLQALKESKLPLPYFAEAIFDHRLTMINAELDWVTRFMKRLQAQSQVEE